MEHTMVACIIIIILIIIIACITLLWNHYWNKITRAKVRPVVLTP